MLRRRELLLMSFALLFLATCFLAYSNGANDNFKGVASLFGSRTCSYPTAISWATVTTFAGSIMSFFLAQTLLKKFSGKGIVPDNSSARVLSSRGRDWRRPNRDRRYGYRAPSFDNARFDWGDHRLRCGCSWSRRKSVGAGNGICAAFIAQSSPSIAVAVVLYLIFRSLRIAWA